MTSLFAALYAPGNLPALLDCAQRFSPTVEITSPDLVTIDVRGMERLLGSPHRIARQIERTIGVPAAIALASNPDTAIYLSRSSTNSTTVVPMGQEEPALAPLSLHLLGCPSSLGELLDLWGLRTFGQLAQLPPLGIAERCGEEGVYWQRQARGAIERRLRLVGEVVRLLKESDWDEPVSTAEPLLFVLGRLLFELCLEMVARSLATTEVRASLRLANQPDHILTLRLPVPLQDRQTLLKLLQQELEQHPAPAPVHGVQVELIPTAPKATQEHLFTAAYPFPDQLQLTVARVRRIVGADRIGTAELLDSHQPDGFVMKPFSPGPREAQACSTGELSLALRRFRPPQPAQVRFEQQPMFLKSPGIFGPVCVARGPWYSSGHWWQTDAWQREEWDVGLAQGAIYKIFRDLATQCWFVEGCYD